MRRSAPLTPVALALAIGSACARPADRDPRVSRDLGRPAPPVGPPPAAPAVSSTAGPTRPAVAPAPAAPAPHASQGGGYRAAGGAFQRGKATYYADSLAGNPTASGEIYDPVALTAAHRDLPFGSVVDVVRSDGRWVRVRITDRGPFAKGRIIDLSRRAAEAIGMIDAGVVDVTLYVVRRPSR